MKTKPNKTKIYGKINTPDKRLKIIKLTRGNGLFRATNEVTEIIIGDRYECYITGNNFSNGSHLMGAVKKDAQKFVESGKKLPEFPKFPVRKTSDKYDFNDGILVGTDVDHAYWRQLSFLKGKVTLEESRVSTERFRPGLDPVVGSS
jgi:hypothetical protein